MSKSGAKFGTGKVGGTVWAESDEVEHVELQHKADCESLLVGSIFDQCSLALTAFGNDKYGTILQFPVQKPLLAFFLLLLFRFGLLGTKAVAIADDQQLQILLPGLSLGRSLADESWRSELKWAQAWIEGWSDGPMFHH